MSLNLLSLYQDCTVLYNTFCKTFVEIIIFGKFQGLKGSGDNFLMTEHSSQKCKNLIYLKFLVTLWSVTVGLNKQRTIVLSFIVSSFSFTIVNVKPMQSHFKESFPIPELSYYVWLAEKYIYCHASWLDVYLENFDIKEFHTLSLKVIHTLEFDFLMKFLS